MYRIAICEDNTVTGEQLLALCDSILSEKEISHTVTHFTNAEELEQALEDGSAFELLLLDIELGGKTGLELARNLRRRDDRVSIIFISSHDDYMRYGYSVQPVHFLIKPVRRLELEEALETDLRLNHHRSQQIHVRSGNCTVLIQTNDIIYAEVMDHILNIHTKDEVIPSRTTLTGFMSLLPDHIFSRCHNSFTVNMHYISNISHNGVLLNNGDSLPIGRKYYTSFQKAFIRYINA